MADNDSIHTIDTGDQATTRRLGRVAGVLGALVVATMFLGTPASAAPPTGEVCSSSLYTWYGETVVGTSNPSASVGVDVPSAVPGETLRVDSLLVNAAVDVSVGGATVIGAGEEITGGAIAVHNDGDDVTVTAVEISVARCAEVAQLAEASTFDSVDATADLPATGSATGPLALAAVVALLAGVVLAGVSRRPLEV